MLVIYYFKKLFILSTILLTIQSVHGQDASSTITSKTIPKIPGTLKLDEQKRAFFIDSQGDKIIVLDYKTRKNLQAVSRYRNGVPIKGRLNSKSFYKETVPEEVKTEEVVEFETYTSKDGDTWESISQELFKDESHSMQLKLWNENLLKYISIPKGSIINYMEIPKN